MNALVWRTRDQLLIMIFDDKYDETLWDYETFWSDEQPMWQSHIGHLRRGCRVTVQEELCSILWLQRLQFQVVCLHPAEGVLDLEPLRWQWETKESAATFQFSHGLWQLAPCCIQRPTDLLSLKGKRFEDTLIHIFEFKEHGFGCPAKGISARWHSARQPGESWRLLTTHENTTIWIYFNIFKLWILQLTQRYNVYPYTLPSQISNVNGPLEWFVKWFCDTICDRSVAMKSWAQTSVVFDRKTLRRSSLPSYPPSLRCHPYYRSVHQIENDISLMFFTMFTVILTQPKDHEIKVWTLFFLLNMKSQKVQKVGHWLSEDAKNHKLCSALTLRKKYQNQISWREKGETAHVSPLSPSLNYLQLLPVLKIWIAQEEVELERRTCWPKSKIIASTSSLFESEHERKQRASLHTNVISNIHDILCVTNFSTWQIHSFKNLPSVKDQ